MLLVRIVVAAAGLWLLARCADDFVLGASALARRLGISRVVIGAVIIGFGTSAPEALVSGLAALGGNADVGVGNVIGSNLANLTLVLGLAGLFGTVAVSSSVLRREAPMTVGAMIAFGVAVQGGISAPEAGGLAVVLAVLLAAIILSARRGGSAALAVDVGEFLDTEHVTTLPREAGRTAVGLVGTLVGAQALVWSAVGLAERAGLSGGFIGLTLVAVGTSLPEIVTAVQAARRDESDLIIGNLLGSNLFNSLGVGAVIGLLAPGAAVGRTMARSGVLLMLGASLVAIVFMRRRFVLTRVEAAALLVGYGVGVASLA